MRADATTEGKETPGEAPRVTVAQLLVHELRVGDAMTKAVVTARPADSLRSIQLLMKQHRISAVPILEQGRLVGVVSIEDIINALDQGHINDPAERWMTRQVVTLRDHFSLVRAVGEFDRRGFGRFPVLDHAGELVGILTQGDITACLMHHLEKRAEEAAAREAAVLAGQTPDLKDTKPVIVRARVRAGDFDSAGRVSQRLRQALRQRGVDAEQQRRAAVVAYEAETNIIIHSVGGHLKATLAADKVIIEAVDEGPGIERLDLALQEGWSTAGPLARELGFGAGLGLPNIQRCSDKFEIQSEPGVGTRLRCEIALRKAAVSPPPPQVSHAN